jgi:hypothetical protein
MLHNRMQYRSKARKDAYASLMQHRMQLFVEHTLLFRFTAMSSQRSVGKKSIVMNGAYLKNGATYRHGTCIFEISGLNLIREHYV